MPSKWTRSFVSSEDTERVLDSLMANGRGRSDAIRILALRYEAVVKRHRSEFSEVEWQVLRSCLGSTNFERAHDIQALPWLVEEALNDGQAKAFDFDRNALEAKLASCSYAELVSIVSVVEGPLD